MKNYIYFLLTAIKTASKRKNDIEIYENYIYSFIRISLIQNIYLLRKNPNSPYGSDS